MDQLLPRPDRARISGPTGPEILVNDNFMDQAQSVFPKHKEGTVEYLSTAKL